MEERHGCTVREAASVSLALAEALGSCEGEAARETVPLLGLPLGVAEAVLQLVRVGLPVPVAEGVSVEETVVEVLAV